MKKLVVLFFILFAFLEVFSQHLPLQIGNQWHYNATGLSGPNYGAIAVDTIRINDKVYYKIERKHYLTGVLLSTTYDRIEGDSNYYRIINGNDSLLINYNWPNGYHQTIQLDSNCIEIKVYSKGNMNFFGINSDFFDIGFGFWCIGQPDTSWLLSSNTITKYFGCFFGNDGWLQGAKINNITYGNLYPLPVELLSFSSSVLDNDVTLNWMTATETNNSGFEIERREMLEARSEEWKVITFVNGQGTTTETKSYSYKDENLSAGKYEYRLKQIDFDGTYEYSNIIEVAILPPAKFSLEQNYPNPFNPSTKISWQSPVSSWQTLKVYDVLGNEVASLVNEYKPAGKFEVEFDANKLSSGVYFYQLKAGNFSSIKKMVLLK